MPNDKDVQFGCLRGLDVIGVHPSPIIHNDELPTTIHAKKKHYNPGMLARLKGQAHALRKLGLKGYLSCCWMRVRSYALRTTTRV